MNDPDTGTRPHAVIEPGAGFRGLLAFDAIAYVAGQHEGPVRGVGTLHIEAGARVSGEVRVGAVIVAGELEGPVAADRVVVASTGRLRGPVETVALEVSEGATIEGAVTTRSAPRGA